MASLLIMLLSHKDGFFEGDGGQVVTDLLRDGLPGQSELGLEDLGHARRGGGCIARHQACADAARQHVVDGAGQFVAHGVDDFGFGVRQPFDNGPRQRRVGLQDVADKARLGAVALAQVRGHAARRDDGLRS
jgi:hypothetical protein